ncbi:hypothetical protein [Pseudomonas kermanshahensis]|nr:hypothetical protein [Pseudomonas kermanshahensis]
MTWTSTDTGQVLLLAMAILGSLCIVWGMRAAAKRKREEGGPCN